MPYAPRVESFSHPSFENEMLSEYFTFSDLHKKKLTDVGSLLGTSVGKLVGVNVSTAEDCAACTNSIGVRSNRDISVGTAKLSCKRSADSANRSININHDGSHFAVDDHGGLFRCCMAIRRLEKMARLCTKFIWSLEAVHTLFRSYKSGNGRS